MAKVLVLEILKARPVHPNGLAEPSESHMFYLYFTKKWLVSEVYKLHSSLIQAVWIISANGRIA